MFTHLWWVSAYGKQSSVLSPLANIQLSHLDSWLKGLGSSVAVKANFTHSCTCYHLINHTIWVLQHLSFFPINHFFQRKIALDLFTVHHGLKHANTVHHCTYIFIKQATLSFFILDSAHSIKCTKYEKLKVSLIDM